MIGVSDKALAICNAHFSDDAKHAGCLTCPLVIACRIGGRMDMAGMIKWRDAINEAAEVVEL